jgi:hypothetical protein
MMVENHGNPSRKDRKPQGSLPGRRRGGVGGGGSRRGGRGEVLAHQFLSPLNPNEIPRYVRGDVDRVMKEVCGRGKRMLEDAAQTGAAAGTLKVKAGQFLSKHFGVGRVLVAVSEDSEYPALNSLIDLALRENRTIYLPDLKRPQVIVNGQHPGALAHFYSATLATFGIDSAGLSALPFGSLVISPMVTGLAKSQPLADYRRHGVVVLCTNNPDLQLFSHYSFLMPLRQFVEYCALAWERLVTGKAKTEGA